MIIIDAMGKPCPIPVVEAKKSLAANPGSAITVIVDNNTAVENLEKMSSGLGHAFSFTEISNTRFEVIIQGGGKNNSKSPAPAAKKAAPAQTQGAMTVAIGTNKMGDGEEELGKILIKGFIYSLTELETPPEHLIFFNSGAFLTSDKSNTVDDIKKLESKGTNVMTCGTCVNYYNLRPAVGKIANMYEITQAMDNAAKVVNI